MSQKKIPSRGALKSLCIKNKIKIIFLILVFWICRRRIRARNKPVKYRNVYKPTTTWNLSVRLSSKNCVSVVLDIPREDLSSAQDLRKKRKKSRH